MVVSKLVASTVPKEDTTILALLRPTSRPKLPVRVKLDPISPPPTERDVNDVDDPMQFQVTALETVVKTVTVT